MDTSQIIAFVLALVWFVSAGVVMYLIPRWRRQAEVWVKTEGTVSRAWTHLTGGRQIHYATYSFLTSDGEKRRGEATTGDKRQSDDVIDIWYDPEDPGRNKATPTDMKVQLMIGGNLMFGFLALGVVALLEGFSVIDLF